ncbi:MAG: hypothetical protein AB8H86_12820 [Polyangiales bacterium]
MSNNTKTRPTRFIPLLIALAAFGLPNLGHAQDDDVTIHDFGDADLVEGHLQSSDMAFLIIRQGVRHGSLIRPRLTFVPELLKSCEDSR